MMARSSRDRVREKVAHTWPDLDPDEIAFKIEQGKCERCSGVESQ